MELYDYEGVTKQGQNNSTVLEMYSKCADDYEKTSNEIKYQAHEFVARKAAEYVKRDGHILDAACGTGMVGQKLSEYGYHLLTALDGCEQMLDKARTKQIYQEFICMILGPGKIPAKDDMFDGVVMAGAFAPGHVKGDCLKEIVRITKPGGYIVTNIRKKYMELKTFQQDTIQPMRELETNGKWRLIEETEMDGYVYEDSEKAIAIVYQVI